MTSSSTKAAPSVAIQDHAAYLHGTHDFQADIERLADNDAVGTILQTVMLATGVRFAAVARVTTTRWVACRTIDEVNFGLAEGDEIEIGSTFCQSVRDTSEAVIFSDVATDDVYRGHPIAAQFGIVSYASVPIRRTDGSFFGTLCAIDTTARDIKNPRVIEMLEMFADIVGSNLETGEQLRAQQELLEQQRRLTRAQEEFVAILGHDLRNPVAAFEAGLRQLSRNPDPHAARQVVDFMRTPLYRMKELIENLLLHAKARLGDGIRVAPVDDAPLAEAITGVVREIRAAVPEHQIELDIQFESSVRCDPRRAAQAIANLLSNAVTHGAAGQPIRVRGRRAGDVVEIAVSNHGAPIPPELHDTLFDPFHRGPSVERDGLGLGLNIAQSIARAHAGHIEVECAGGVTTFRMVLPQPGR